MTDPWSDPSAQWNQDKAVLNSNAGRSASNIPIDEGSQDLKRKLLEALQNPDSKVEGDATAALRWLSNPVAKDEDFTYQDRNPFHNILPDPLSPAPGFYEPQEKAFE